MALAAGRPPLSVPGQAISGTDQGAAPGDEDLSRMVLLLAPSVTQQQALAAELADLQNPSSPQYHRWLTPAAFADAYANSPADVAAVAGWLESERFRVAPLPAGRGWIEFSGTVAQAEEAFRTQIDLVASGNGSARPVVMGNISVPAALAPLVGGLVSLDGVVSRPALTAPQQVGTTAGELAAETWPAAAEALTPRLAAQLVDLAPLAGSNVTGTGQIVAIASRSNVNPADVAAFRSAFGLPASPLAVTLDGADPGLTDAQAEATLAASWAGAAAPGARVVLVPAATTNATDGVDLSLAAIVDGDLASTVAVGYSACEAGMSAAHRAFYASLYRQAAAEGMAVITAAGDSGAAACAAPGAPVSTGYGVNALASTPWDTAVGVAAFGAAGPAAGGAALTAWSPVDPADPPYAGGGGRSAEYVLPSWQPEAADSNGDSSSISAAPIDEETAGRTETGRQCPDCAYPTWLGGQSGVTYVPPGGGGLPGRRFRTIPDLSLPTAIDTSANPGLAYCLSAGLPEDGALSVGRNAARPSATGCTLVRSGGSGAAASYFAGIASLMAEEHGAQGNLAPGLYRLGEQKGIFNDVQQGGAELSCTAGSPGCGADGQIGFTAGPGYDMATGLGVPDAASLVEAEPDATGTSAVTVTNTTASGQTIDPSGSVVLSATVTSGTGGAAPTGTVTMFDQSTGITLGVDTLTQATSTASNVQQTVTGQLAPGSHAIVAEYGGDATYEAANSEAVTVNVSGATPTVSLTPATANPVAGSSDTLNVTIAPPAGGTAPAPTGTVTIMLDGGASGTVGVTPGTPSTASYTLEDIALGSHTVEATYNGDSNYAGADSQTITITAARGSTVTTVTATPPTLTAGTPETLTATIAPTGAVPGATYTMTGTIAFYDGATQLGQAAVSNNSATIGGVTLANNVSHSITAVYSGDTNWVGSTSAALTLAPATLPDTVVLTSNDSAAQPGATIVLTATVTPNSAPLSTGEANPTGAVVFYQGTTVIGSASLVPAQAGDSATATLSAESLPGGQDTLTAQYQGDGFYSAAASNALTLTVEAFSITPCGSNPANSVNIVQGGAGSECFNITGQGGFNNLVQVICTPPAGDNMTCTSSPQQVTPPGTVTFVVQTYTTPPASASLAGHGPTWPRAAGGAALAGLLFLLLPWGRRARTFLGAGAGRALILLLLLVGLGGAGMGCSSGNALAPYGTPLGEVTIQVTATAYQDSPVVSQSVYFTVDVVAP